MYYDEESGTSGFIAGLLIGAVVGAAFAVLTASESGRTTRRRLLAAVRHGDHDEGDGRFDAEVEAAVRAGRRRARR